MKTFTPDNSDAMAKAIFDAFGPFSNLGLEQAVFATAEGTSEAYDGGSWTFATNDDGTIGFWYPNDSPAYSVACQNYYEHPAMPATAFGAACTLVAFNQLIWMLHQRNVGSDIVDLASDHYHRLRNWIFDLADEEQLDGTAVAGFID